MDLNAKGKFSQKCFVDDIFVQCACVQGEGFIKSDWNDTVMSTIGPFFQHKNTGVHKHMSISLILCVLTDDKA